MRDWTVVVVAAAALALTPGTAPAQASPPSYVQPYGAGDAGGFYDVLPPGEAGVDNALQLAAFEANGTIPPNFADQQSLYQNLLYAAPTLESSQIPQYFKDATFGVRPTDQMRSEQPEAGVTILRDRYDVPHIYGQTRGEVEFGAGYAAAEDRLFMIDVLRHVAEASLSSFIGGAAGNQAMDEATWTVAPYTQADLQQQLTQGIARYGAAGAQAVADAQSFVDGINAYIQAAQLNPMLMPGEYAAIGKLPATWSVTDVLALASLIGNAQGKGGGDEVASALTEEAFERRFGHRAGRRAWMDFRQANDATAPTTVSRPFPYETAPAFSPAGLAMPDPGSVTYVSPGATNPDGAQARDPGPAPAGAPGYTFTPAPIAIPRDGSIGARLLYDFYGHHPHASNWELVNAAHSTSGHAIAVMGPQVGYYVPEILMEEDLHGPGIDARGAAFPGINGYVQLGHGADYAWSATTANSDDVDTFAEVLCQDDYHYLYRGQCVPMDKLVRTNSWTPNADDSTPPGSATLTTYRTVHGLVFARGTVHGRRVAFVTARDTYFHEADSVIGFMELNDPSFVTGPRAFQHAVSNINLAFNWAYVDAKHIAYYQSGWYPVRAPHSSPDFPILGTGQFDWRGYDPATHTERNIAYAAHPNAVDPAYLVSWNNKQAPRWGAADDNYAYGDVYRSQLIADHITADLAHGHGRMGIAQLVQAMDLAATEDIRIVKLWPLLRSVLGTPADPRLRGAIAALGRWYRHGGHRWDLAKSGTDADNRAIETLDAWWPKLLAAEFQPALGTTVFGDLQGMIGFGGVAVGGQPTPADFAAGWYGYVSQDLRDLLAARRHRRRRRPLATVPGAYSRIYCGGGSLRRCRAALRRSLLAALAVTPTQLYGQGYCSSDPEPSCFDQNNWTDIGAISLPNFPFQNRPTFQQVVETQRTLPR